MRKIIVSEFLTLDGVMEAPGEQDELDGRGGWTIPYWNDAIAAFKHDELFASDALLLGRVTYDDFSKVWPVMKDAGDYGERMNSLPKYVATTNHDAELEWNAAAIGSDLINEVRQLKAQPGQDILVFGSATLVQWLLEHSLIDEYRLLVYPVVLGVGKHLFADRSSKQDLKLADAKVFDSGVTLLTYHARHVA